MAADRAINVITRRLPPKEDQQNDDLQRIKKASAPTTKARVAKPSGKAASLKAHPTPKAGVAKKPTPAPRSRTKTDKILDLLRRPGGVTLKELAKQTGWQPNSVRGFLSGTIGKKMGTPVESFKSIDGDRSYHLSSK